MPPPGYEEYVGILPGAPATENLTLKGSGFEQMSLDRLESLEVGQSRLEAMILGREQRSQTFIRGRRALRPLCRHYQTTLVERTRRLWNRSLDWLRHPAIRFLAYCFIALDKWGRLVAMYFRLVGFRDHEAYFLELADAGKEFGRYAPEAFRKRTFWTDPEVKKRLDRIGAILDETS